MLSFCLFDYVLFMFLFFQTICPGIWWKWKPIYESGLSLAPWSTLLSFYIFYSLSVHSSLDLRSVEKSLLQSAREAASHVSSPLVMNGKAEQEKRARAS